MVHKCGDLGDLKGQLEAAGGKLVVIDFFAEWCGPCKMIAPKIEEMAAQMSNVVFLKVDVDEAEDAAQEYNVQAMPTFVLIKNKQKVSNAENVNHSHKDFRILEKILSSISRSISDFISNNFEGFELEYTVLSTLSFCLLATNC